MCVSQRLACIRLQSFNRLYLIRQSARNHLCAIRTGHDILYVDVLQGQVACIRYGYFVGDCLTDGVLAIFCCRFGRYLLFCLQRRFAILGRYFLFILTFRLRFRFLRIRIRQFRFTTCCRCIFQHAAKILFCHFVAVLKYSGCSRCHFTDLLSV